MEGENADESAGESNPSGPDRRRRITTKREPREARDEQSTVTGQHVPRRMSGKTTPQGHAVAVTTQEASDGSREKTMGDLARIVHVQTPPCLCQMNINSVENQRLGTCRDDRRHERAWL